MQTLFEYIKQKCAFSVEKTGVEIFSGKRLEDLLTGMDIEQITEFVDLDVRNIIISPRFTIMPPFKELTTDHVNTGDLEISGIIYVAGENKIYFK